MLHPFSRRVLSSYFVRDTELGPGIIEIRNAVPPLRRYGRTTHYKDAQKWNIEAHQGLREGFAYFLNSFLS